MKVGENLICNIFWKMACTRLSITYVGKEKVDCSMGTFNCLKFNPTIIPGRIFRKDSKLYLWITDDDNRIPVKAHVEVVVGSLTMELTGCGLKSGTLKDTRLNPIEIRMKINIMIRS